MGALAEFRILSGKAEEARLWRKIAKKGARSRYNFVVHSLFKTTCKGVSTSSPKIFLLD